MSLVRLLGIFLMFPFFTIIDEARMYVDYEDEVRKTPKK